MAAPDRRIVLGALLVVLVVALYLLSLAVGASSGSIDDGDRDLMGSLGSGLRSLPGLGSDLDPDDIDPSVDCFDRARSEFVAEPPGRCRFPVPEGIDRVRLVLLSGPCTVEVTGQPGAFDSRSDSAEWDGGRHDVTLTGDGATITLSSDGGAAGGATGSDQSCVLALDR